MIWATLIWLILFLTAAVAAPTTTTRMTNAEALRRGLPLARPRSFPPKCGNGLDCEAKRAAWERFRHVRRQSQPSGAPPPASTATPSNFGATCVSPIVTMEGETWILGASCKTVAGAFVPSTLDLATCLSVNPANPIEFISPVIQPPNFFTTFAGMVVGCALNEMGNTIELQCIGLAFGLVAMIDLETVVGNNNGALYCVAAGAFTGPAGL